ncbi:SDR family NAD(P)-dependent oxidoreductase [Conexibacter sp. JD483]|uniref:SDR family NAD(P)-dependent oxidoreductase n=1 Tax=unclassified Conexibacter TaxID=2627773 RepID=UPI00271BFCDA|nr:MULTISPECIES: SDR family NAD(P)-dependent oxidoreductase [unclassified Conexibacter]MDO8186961.1 SDR family NAD(P)-dependent oxidoreductase [Conexibacter sp. CPCC 205706]MDO8200584.1 SDR family NAD(P)-dependent oxidoreductase [Conexibacter sp. CPCC 205762]MDR9368838.1 SDR family NAD(P)-dependent oxidoreductase [Conexibacter sp. JD483]
MSRFAGRTAVVTGAASGIGEACARLLAAEGAAVVVGDLDGDGAARVAQEIEAAGGRALAIATDVGDSAQVERMLTVADERLGGIDVLVNNAGVLRLDKIVDVSDEAWEFTLRTNLTSVFYCSRGAARRMIAQGRGGRIVSISSIHAVLSEPDGGPYTAAKGGIEAFSRTLAAELAPHGVTVNCVRPGATWTALSRPLYTAPVLAALKQRIPLGEIGEPEQIAQAVAHFASDASRYSTGTTLDVDGGYIMDGSLPAASY